MNYYIIFNLLALLRSLAIQIGRGMDHLLPGGLRGMALWTKQSVAAKSQPSPMKNWKPGRKLFLSPLFPGTHQMTFTMGMKLMIDLWLFYKSLPHRTYCFDGDKPAGSAKRKDRLTLLIITNMDGSDHRKLSVIGKSKTPCCLQKKYKMQVKDMSVDLTGMLQKMPGWLVKYTIKSWPNLTMKWDSQIITYCMFVTMLPATRFESIPTSSSLCYPPMPLQLCSH